MAEDKKLERVAFRCEEEFKKQLEREAKLHGRTLSQHIYWILENRVLLPMWPKPPKV